MERCKYIDCKAEAFWYINHYPGYIQELLFCDTHLLSELRTLGSGRVRLHKPTPPKKTSPNKDKMKFPRMSTWVKKYGPFSEVENRRDLDNYPTNRILSICTHDNGRSSYGDPGIIRIFNVETYLISTHPMPGPEDNINVVGISQAGF